MFLYDIVTNITQCQQRKSSFLFRANERKPWVLTFKPSVAFKAHFHLFKINFWDFKRQFRYFIIIVHLSLSTWIIHFRKHNPLISICVLTDREIFFIPSFSSSICPFKSLSSRTPPPYSSLSLLLFPLPFFQPVIPPPRLLGSSGFIMKVRWDPLGDNLTNPIENNKDDTDETK